jgi:hypothetical protein
MKEMLEKEICTDMTLNVDGKIIKTHKCVLACRSRKFEKLIKQMGENQELKITNASYPLFERLLTWMYAGEIEMPSDIFDVIELSRLAEEFSLVGL